jgi:hypothetical protein
LLLLRAEVVIGGERSKQATERQRIQRVELVVLKVSPHVPMKKNSGTLIIEELALSFCTLVSKHDL